MSALLKLAERCEAAAGELRALNREIALAVGWHRYSPSEIGKSNPGWIAPEDFIGEYESKDGRRRPMLDSLHGTDIWREPRNYSGSLDAAAMLVPEGMGWLSGWGQTVPDEPMGGAIITPHARFAGHHVNNDAIATGEAATPALALCAAALRARATGEREEGK